MLPSDLPSSIGHELTILDSFERFRAFAPPAGRFRPARLRVPDSELETLEVCWGEGGGLRFHEVSHLNDGAPRPTARRGERCVHHPHPGTGWRTLSPEFDRLSGTRRLSLEGVNDNAPAPLLNSHCLFPERFT